jgi:hypothetical protein
MADSMEGVVTEGEPPQTENVEQKTIAGELAAAPIPHHGCVFVSLRRMHQLKAASPHVSHLHDCYQPGLPQVSISRPR